MNGSGLGDSWAFYMDEQGMRRPRRAFAILLLVGLLLTVIGPTAGDGRGHRDGPVATATSTDSRRVK
jgi:hypothetical protein